MDAILCARLAAANGAIRALVYWRKGGILPLCASAAL